MSGANNPQGAPTSFPDTLQVSQDIVILFSRVDVVSATGQVARYVHQGDDITLRELSTAVTGALAVGSAIVTATIDGGGSIGAATIDTGGGAGDVDSAAIASVTISDGETLELTVSGTNTASEFADCTVRATKVLTVVTL